MNSKNKSKKQTKKRIAQRMALLKGLSPAARKRLKRQMKDLPPLPDSKENVVRGVVYSPYKRWRSHY